MFRKVTTLVIATLISSTLLAQQPADPVADMTAQIISQYLPKATNQGVSSTSFSSTSEAAAPRMAAPATNAGINATSATSLPGLGFAPRMPLFDIGKTGGFGGGFAGFGGLSRTAMGSQLGGAAAAPQATSAVGNAGFAAAPVAAAAPARALPVAALARPRSFSAASNNGIHAISAVVDTDDGPEEVKLKGDRAAVLKQLDLLSPQARRVMKRSLGVK